MTYFEMNDAEKMLNHINDSIDFALCVISEGFQDGINSEFTVERINDINSDTCEGLIRASKGVQALLEAYKDK
ncbi:hypothetical protein ACTQ6A_02890 [Lachnospiraceae bacterium LCP25S3_G4]